jgi:hypothetical protein
MSASVTFAGCVHGNAVRHVRGIAVSSGRLRGELGDRRKPGDRGQTGIELQRRVPAFEGLGGLGPVRRRAVVDVYTRATVQPAIDALRAVGLTDERVLAKLRIEQLTPDGAELRLRDRTITVPVHLRRALARQRLHATVVGQRPHEQLLTYDGSVPNPSSLAWY